MSADSILVLVHAGLGTLALTTFWTAGLARKGSPVHVAAGRTYLLAMVALLLFAVPLSIATLVERPVAGAFLLYLLVITGTAVWTSWRAIKDKRDWARYTGRAYRALMWANLASALAIGAVGVLLAQFAQVVIVSFAGIGLATFVRMWRFSRAAPAEPRWWMREHLLASHTTTEQVGKLATEAGVKTLVLSHFVPGGYPFVPDDVWAAGARKHFSGRIIVGRDLLEI